MHYRKAVIGLLYTRQAQGINPLSEVEVSVKNRLEQDTRRHLSFHFNRVQEDGAVRHLLVTAQDISARIELEAKLQSERQRSQKEFAMLLKAMDADPALLRQFVARTETSLLEINDIMRSTSAKLAQDVAADSGKKVQAMVSCPKALLDAVGEIAKRARNLCGAPNGLAKRPALKRGGRNFPCPMLARFSH